MRQNVRQDMNNNGSELKQYDPKTIHIWYDNFQNFIHSANIIRDMKLRFKY